MVRRLAVLLVCLAATACHRAETPPERPAAVPFTNPGFPPTAAAARARLEGLTVAPGQHRETYRSSAFGPAWSDETEAPGGRNGCGTAEDVLHRDLTVLRRGDRDACVPLTAVLRDPYTGRRLPYASGRASRISADHVVPLGAAWQAGAWAWTPAQRLRYANDLEVLLAVDARAYHAKGGRTPDRWRPRRGYWCEYARRWTGIKVKYALTVTPSEKTALADMLGTCG